MNLKRLFTENFSSEEMLVSGVIVVIAVFWIATLFDVLTSRFNGNSKIPWFLTVFFLPGLGTIIYLILGKESKINNRRFTPF